MSYKIPDKKILISLLAPTALLFIILLLLQQNFIFSFFISLIYCVFVIAFLNHKIGLYLLIVLRPCLDYFTNNTFNVGSFTFNFAQIFALLSIIFTIFVIIQNFKKFEKLPLLAAWLIFFAGIIISWPFSYDTSSSLIEITRLISVFLIFSASGLLIKNNQDLVTLIKVIIASAIIPSVMAFYQYFTKTGLTVPFEGVFNRVYGTFSHPNLLAFYLLLVLSLCFVIFLVSDKKKISIIFYGLLAVLFLITLALTYTRSAWLGLVLIVVLLGFTRYRTFLVVALVFLSLSYFSFQQINDRFSTLNTKDPTDSVQWRLTLWQDEISYILQKPVFGYGVGTSKEIILKNRGADAGSTDAHNDYLRMALESGVVGLVSFIILIVALLKNLAQIYLKEKRPRLKTLAFVILILMIGFYLISFGDNILANTALQWALWALLGGFLATQKNLLLEKNPSK